VTQENLGRGQMTSIICLSALPPEEILPLSVTGWSVGQGLTFRGLHRERVEPGVAAGGRPREATKVVVPTRGVQRPGFLGWQPGVPQPH